MTTCYSIKISGEMRQATVRKDYESIVRETDKFPDEVRKSVKYLIHTTGYIDRFMTRQLPDCGAVPVACRIPLGNLLQDSQEQALTYLVWDVLCRELRYSYNHHDAWSIGGFL